MTIPTTGTYSGVTIYQVSGLSGLGGIVSDALNTLEGVVGLVLPSVSTLISSLVVVRNTVATDATVTFAGNTITAPGVTLTDATITNQGPSAFEFTSSDGNSYVLSNGPVTGLSIDDVINDAKALAGSLGLAGLPVVVALDAFQAVVDTLINNVGGFTVFPGSVFGNGGTYAPPCFVRGTRIETQHGPVAVENLVEGDLVVLARGGSAAVTWVGHRRVDLALHASPETARPIRIAAGALGDGLPLRDLRVSPDHALFMDGVLVPAGLLVNGRTIVQENVAKVEYFHVELPVHDVILAEGAACESYLDTGNRNTFANARLVALVPDLAIDAAAIEAASTCAPMILNGEILATLRARIDAVVIAGVAQDEGHDETRLVG